MKKKHLFPVHASGRKRLMLTVRLSMLLIFGFANEAKPASGSFSAPRDLTMATSNGDLLHATQSKLLLRWDGFFAGARMPHGEEPLGGGLMAREKGLTVSELFRRVPMPQALPAPLRALAGEKKPAGWICTNTSVSLLLSPNQEDPESLEVVTVPSRELLGLIPELSNPEETSQAQLVACTADEQGKLLIVTRIPSRLNSPAKFLVATPLEKSATILLAGPKCNSRNRESTCNLAVHEVALAFVGASLAEPARPGHWRVVSKATASLGSPPETSPPYKWLVHDLSENFGSQLTRLWDHPLQESRETPSRITARSDTILAWDGQDITLTKLPNAEDALLRAERLPVSPCSDEQLCGLSLAADGTWAAAGFWGAYAGRGSWFRRLDVPTLVTETGRLDLAHSGMPGDLALFGSDDSSIERIAFDIPQPSPLQMWPQTTPACCANRQAVVWLRPGQAPLPHEQVLLHLKPPTSKSPATSGPASHGAGALEQQDLVVALTAGDFDPTRHLAYEHAVDLPSLKAPERTPTAGFQATAENSMWWHEALQSQQISDLLKAASVTPDPVTVALLDSGADLQHDDFHPFPKKSNPGSGQWQPTARQERLVATTTSSMTIGHDFIDEDNVPQDQYGHGTHVSGLAKPPFSGFDSIRLLIVRVLDAQGKSNSIAIGRGFLYAARIGASIINASWGGGPRTQFMADAIQAAQKAGVLVVTSAGNDRLNIDRDPPVPAHVPGVVSIGAMTEQGRRAPFSNFGKTAVLLFAPGSSIESLSLGGGFKVMSGTSMAAPLFVAQVAAALGVARHLGRYPATDQSWQGDLVQRFCSASGAQAQSQDTSGARRNRLLDISRCGALRPLPVFETLLAGRLHR